MSKEKNKSDFKAKSMAKLQEWGVLAVEISISAAEMVLTLELNLKRDKTGDVGKFHDTNIILIIIHFRYKDRLAICCLKFSFSMYIMGSRDSILLMTVVLMVFTYWSWIKKLFTYLYQKSAGFCEHVLGLYLRAAFSKYQPTIGTISKFDFAHFWLIGNP